MLLTAWLMASAKDITWATYTNKRLGYKIQYPDPATRLEAVEDIRQGFYFDPLQPITDLEHQPGFAGITIMPRSLVKVSFPDKYLIMLILDHIPDETPPPASQTIIINGHRFYQQHSWDAGMCHNYDYFTYYFKNADKYFVFIFLVTNSCHANDNFAPLEKSDGHLNTVEFEKILASFQLLKVSSI